MFKKIVFAALLVLPVIGGTPLLHADVQKEIEIPQCDPCSADQSSPTTPR